MKLSEATGPFLQYCRAERHVSGSTVAKYQDCMKSWLLPCLGEQSLADLSRLHVLELRHAMLDRHLSPARQYSVIMCLKSLLKFCRSVLGQACLDPVEVPLPKRSVPEVSYLSNEEIQQILGAINTATFTGLRLHALVELLLSTGMRISEALSLTRQPFDAGKTEAEIVGKGSRRRHVFFSDRCRTWVEEYLHKRIDDHPALFVTTGYPVRPLKREDVSRFFINLRRRAGLTKKLTPHILRHTFCTNLLFHGADITHIKDLAGHQDIQTTARYYLGKDKRVLKQVVDQCLDYGPQQQLPLQSTLRYRPQPRV